MLRSVQIAKDWVNDFDDNGKDHRGNPKASADDTPVAVNVRAYFLNPIVPSRSLCACSRVMLHI